MRCRRLGLNACGAQGLGLFKLSAERELYVAYSSCCLGFFMSVFTLGLCQPIAGGQQGE
jgi:hypothetical protein